MKQAIARTRTQITPKTSPNNTKTEAEQNCQAQFNLDAIAN